MKYLNGKSKLKSGEAFTINEIQQWISYVSKPMSFKDFFNGRRKSKQLLFKNFENIISNLSVQELILLKEDLTSMPNLVHKINEMFRRMLEEQVSNKKYINPLLLEECFFVVYYEDTKQNFNEDAKNMKHYLEGNFYKIIKKGLFPYFSDTYGYILSKALQENKEFEDDVFQVLKEKVKHEGKDSYQEDFKWFTEHLLKFDSNYLFNHILEFLNILPPRKINYFLGLLEKNPNIEKSSKIFVENAENFIRETPTPLSTLKKIKELNVFFGERALIDIEKLKEILNTREYDIAEEISRERFNEKETKILGMLLADIADNEGCNIGDLEIIGRGGFSEAYKLGNKVIKLGKKPYQYRISRNHRRFLQR